VCRDATTLQDRVVANVRQFLRLPGLLGFRVHEYIDASPHSIGPLRGCVPRMSRRLPTIHKITDLGDGPFRRQQLDLEFSNGQRRIYERQLSRGHGAVVVVPMLDAQTVLLVREYAAGVHRYELGLVKGRIDAGETPEQATDRELKEEVGYGARQIQVLRAMTLAPAYMSHQSWLVLARDLYPERLVGDEPEEVEVVLWPIARLDQLMLREDFSEGRSLAALFIVRQWLECNP